MARVDNNLSITPAHLRLNSFVRAARNRMIEERTSKAALRGLRAKHETKEVPYSRQYSIENNSN